MVTIISGANSESLDVQGDTVADVRRRFGTLLNIPAEAAATINGESAVESDVLYAGDKLVFAKATAQKG